MAMREGEQCLGVPARVVSVEGNVASVDFWGLRKRVRLETVDEPVEPGDYVLSHAGFAIRRVPSRDVAEILSLYEMLLNYGALDEHARVTSDRPRGC
jgi:hydrogenase expression/formation protein HypC